jgi:hypothetical protein
MAAWSTLSPPTDSGYRVIEVWGVRAALAAVPDRDPHAFLERLTGEESPDYPPPQQFLVHAVRIAEAK